MDFTELQHHGIKGMRWGIRRFQKKNGSLTEAGKKRYSDDPEENKRLYEEDKQRALKSGSATDVLKFKGDLTQNEMNTALARIQWEQNMKAISDREIAAGKDKAGKFFKQVETVTGYANTTAKAWNTVANVINAFSNSDVSLPKIDTDITKGNKTIRKLEKKKKAEEDAKAAEKAEADAKAAKEAMDKQKAEKKAARDARKQEKAEKKARKNKETIIDADWTEVSVSDIPSEQTSNGQAFVAGLLEEPK